MTINWNGKLQPTFRIRLNATILHMHAETLSISISTFGLECSISTPANAVVGSWDAPLATHSGRIDRSWAIMGRFCVALTM